MSISNQNLKSVYHTEVSHTNDQGFMIRFDGRSSTGRRNSFTVELGWWVVPMILRQIYTAWQKERSNRINEICRLDEALKGGQSK